MWLEESFVLFSESTKDLGHQPGLLEQTELRGKQGRLRKLEKSRGAPHFGMQVGLEQLDVRQESHLDPLQRVVGLVAVVLALAQVGLCPLINLVFATVR